MLITNIIVLRSINLKNKSPTLYKQTSVCSPINISSTAKRSMWKVVAKDAGRIINVTLFPKTDLMSQQSNYATYKVLNTNVLTTTHEHAQKNPILAHAGGKIFQHPSFVQDVCEISDCEHKLCTTSCGSVTKSHIIAHGTHNGQFLGVTYLSTTDLAQENRAQFGKFYNKSVSNNSVLNATVNTQQTDTLNSNKEMLNNIQTNAQFVDTDKSINNVD